MRQWEGPREWSPRKVPKFPLLPKFVDAYLEAAIWSTTDRNGDPFDAKYSIQDFSKKAIAEAVEDCNTFIQWNRKDLEASGGSVGQHGHDLWLTRNGHGAGFWDRGYDEELADRLSDAARSLGELGIYADHGKLFFEPN